MKLPTRTVTHPDWEALYELLLVGPVVIDEMTVKETRAFNMHCRTYHNINIQYQRLFTGGMALKLGRNVE